MYRAAIFLLSVGCLPFFGSVLLAQDTQLKSHPPMRPLPVVSNRPLVAGPKRFVDSIKGNDTAAGTEPAPWRTLAHATRQLALGETLYLRGGNYYEKVSLTKSGTAEAPITIAA